LIGGGAWVSTSLVTESDPTRTFESGGALYARPMEIARPALHTAPFIFASPHSGRLYPASFVAQSRLSATSLRRSEDAYVEELFEGAVALGAPLIAARFPRAYLDVNRSQSELDPTMFDGPLTLAHEPSSPRVQAGLGVIPRIVRDGAEIYRARLPVAEAQERLARLYRPYHAELARMTEETRAHFGAAILVDCHSMPSAAAVPDVVLGDRYGISASPQLMRAAERCFEKQGFSTARNSPYAGGYTTHLYGRPARGVHAVQVEINRGLYLDEEKVVRGARFDEMKARIARALRDLVAIDIGGLRGFPLAAE
jgi:N-formylglutamate deformylase